MPEMPLVVYHIASMGNWKEVVTDQFKLLKEVELNNIIITHVGKELTWVVKKANEFDLNIRVAKSNDNTDHYETFAMYEIERLAKQEKTDKPIMYLHTKGVSVPWHLGKRMWRQFMEFHTIRQWKWNIEHALKDHDAVGVNWFNSSKHFCGNFWIAKPDWIRRLPDYKWYHEVKSNCTRFSCEFWIGSNHECRAWSLAGINDLNFWYDDFDWTTIADFDFKCQMISPQPKPKNND